MFLLLKKIGVSAPVCLLMLFFCLQPAGGYVLSGAHVLQLMLDNVSLPQRLLIKQKLILFDPGLDAGGSEVRQTVRYRLPEQFRSDIETYELNRIYMASADISLTVLNGRVIGDSDTWMDHYKDIFFYRSRERLMERLQKTGIDVSVSSLGRYNGKIAFVIGAQYPDESSPQLWVDKETFRPLRWIFRSGDVASGTEALEILYSGWQNYSHAFYPNRIDFLQGRHPVRRIQVEGMDLNPDLSAAVFDIGLVKGAYSHDAGTGTPETQKSDIEKTIENFRKIYE